MSSINKKILLLQETYLPLIGGAEMHVYYLTKQLIERGCYIEIITGTPSNKIITDKNGEICKIHRYQMSYGKKDFAKLPIWIIRLIFHARKFDLIHVHYSSFLAFISVLAGKLLRKRVVITLHGFGTLDSSVGKSWLKRIYRYVSLNFANRIVATSQEMKHVALRYSSADKIVLIENGVDTNAFSSPPDRSFDRVTACIRLATLRRLVPKNGVQFVIDALGTRKKQLSFFLKVVGDGRLMPIIQSKIKSNDLMNSIDLLGSLAHNEVVKILGQVDVVIFMSTAESTSLAALESMSMGCIVVCTNVGAFPDFVSDGQTGFIINIFEKGHSDYAAPKQLQNWQYEALIDQLVEIQNRPPVELKRISDNAQKFVRENYDWKVIVGRIIADCYQ
ncbi:MAG: hypothetical protein DRR19_21635 [Candidatus Parabeggiatoa sp. nov. 1]|nr:MAG: hypothetical protein DRR19_21635 [Gammaproteobacteria bacterium]